MTGLNTEFIEEGLKSIRETAIRECNDYIRDIAQDLINHINDSLNEV